MRAHVIDSAPVNAEAPKVEDSGGRAPDTPDAGPRGPLAAALAVGFAASVGLLRTGYQFDGWYGDDQVWLTLIVDRIEPGLLANDPVVQLIGDRYRSGLFDLVVAMAPFVTLPSAFLAIFLTARLLACAAMYRLALTFSASIPAAAIATLLFSAAPVTSFGGILFVEPILTPRGLALPFALLSLDAFLRRRLLRMTATAVLCLYLHIGSGLNLVGVLAFCGLLLPGASPTRGLLGALALLAVTAILLVVSSGAIGPEALRLDPEWAAIVSDTVGPWVYLRRTAPYFVLTSLWLPVLATASIASTGTPAQRQRFVGFALAAAAALAIHLVGVDWLEVRPLLQASPQRATLALEAISLAAVGTWVARSLAARDPLLRALAGAFLLGCVLVEDPGFAFVGGLLLALAWRLRATSLRPRWRAALAAAIVGAAAVTLASGLATSFQWSPERIGSRVALVRASGVDEAWAALQTYIREQSDPGDVVMAPPPLSPRVFARRPSAMRLKMQSFTHVSREFAFAFADWQRETGAALPDADTRGAIAIAAGVGADWLVLDDRLTPPAAGDPAPRARSGPYRAYRIVAGGRSEVRGRARDD